MYAKINLKKNEDREVEIMGKDRQERKLRKSNRVEADRDQALHYGGATRMQSPEEARKEQRR
jgi:YpzI-like protein